MKFLSSVSRPLSDKFKKDGFMGYESEVSKESFKHKIERILFAITVAFAIFSFQNCSVTSVEKVQIEKASEK